VVAIIVKLDDIGLALTERSDGLVGRIGHGLLIGTPKLLAVISVVGVAAMLWVGGHIELVGLDELGWHAPYSFVHDVEHHVHHALEDTAGWLAATLGWLTNTLLSAVFGLVIGAVLVAVVSVLPSRSHGADAEDSANH
jgi:uncharacterized protein